MMAEGERTGVMVGFNIHDYISDFGGQEWRGCLATLQHDTGKTLLYTTSTPLQLALETAYVAKARVALSFVKKSLAAFSAAKDDPEVGKWLSAARTRTGSEDGPFSLKAIWTIE